MYTLCYSGVEIISKKKQDRKMQQPTTKAISKLAMLFQDDIKRQILFFLWFLKTHNIEKYIH